jgi:hypothetical protein
MRSFLKILNEFKLINKTLSTKEIVKILAADNNLVYDFENAYNLDFEITFLEFFEALIGCALVTYKDKDLTKISSNEIEQKKSDQIEQAHIDSVSEKNITTTRSQLMSAQKSSQNETLRESKKELRRG